MKPRTPKTHIVPGTNLIVATGLDPQAGLLVATESAVFRYEGADVAIVAGQTRVREGHPILKGREHLFKPITAHYEIESATAAPGERRGSK